MVAFVDLSGLEMYLLTCFVLLIIIQMEVQCVDQLNVGDAVSMSGRCVKVISSQTLVAPNGHSFQVPQFCFLYKRVTTDEAIYYKPAESHYWWSNQNVNCSSSELICGPDLTVKPEV